MNASQPIDRDALLDDLRTRALHLVSGCGVWISEAPDRALYKGANNLEALGMATQLIDEARVVMDRKTAPKTNRRPADEGEIDDE